MTVIPFPSRPPPDDNVLLFTIDIYAGDRDGFSWIVRAESEEGQPDIEQLSGYLTDMFITLNPERQSIFSRLTSFLRTAFNPKDRKNETL